VPHTREVKGKSLAARNGFFDNDKLPGAVVASEIQGQQLDAESLRPFWKAAANLGLYVFVHPLPRVISWSAMDADDLGRMLGWNSP
jgi:hypothetical protein